MKLGTRVYVYADAVIQDFEILRARVAELEAERDRYLCALDRIATPGYGFQWPDSPP